jgi:hypothetical protein
MDKLQNLVIEQTSKTPLIDLNYMTGELILSGKSIPENASKLYGPVLNWVTEYILNAKPLTNFRLDMEYFNTTSSIWLAKILKVLVLINEPECVLLIHLYLHVEEFDEIKEYEDISEVFPALSNIPKDALPSIGLKLYGTDDKGKIVKDAFVFMDSE